MKKRDFNRFLMVVVSMAIVLSACGESPLGSLGERSSGWINEPEIVTTTLPPVTVPKSITSAQLSWSNDEIVTENLSDPEALVAEVFARRAGDRFIQASRAEIATTVPGIQFPGVAPYGAEWVSSQLVIENNGEMATEPRVAFGIWSAEPYSRSRSVAQMAVIRVSFDPTSAAELAEDRSAASCARFAEVSTTSCDILDLGGKAVWSLKASSGTTLVWFDGELRYELFGRSFVSTDILRDMAEQTVPLTSLTPSGS